MFVYRHKWIDECILGVTIKQEQKIRNQLYFCFSHLFMYIQWGLVPYLPLQKNRQAAKTSLILCMLNWKDAFDSNIRMFNPTWSISNGREGTDFFPSPARTKSMWGSGPQGFVITCPSLSGLAPCFLPQRAAAKRKGERAPAFSGHGRGCGQCFLSRALFWGLQGSLAAMYFTCNCPS